MISVGVVLYGVGHFGLKETWVELVLNLFYLACLVMMWMFFFNRLKPIHFNYYPLRATTSYAYVLLCPKAMEELLQA